MVRRWFSCRMNDHAMQEEDSLPTNSLPDGTNDSAIVVHDANVLSNNAPGSSSDVPKVIGQKVADASKWEFEARSSRDGAWYDVGSFLSCRFLHTGEPEVRVRFEGFNADHDEWVNVKTAVRERSIPLESSDCQIVAVGDLVLCFRETGDLEAYYDAHVLEIQRKLHDIRGCRCLFLVRYDDDRAEDRVHLKRLCRRPVFTSANGHGPAEEHTVDRGEMELQPECQDGQGENKTDSN